MVEIRGRCEKIENRDRHNGFATLLFERFLPEGQTECIRAIGPVAEPKEGKTYVLEGNKDQNDFFRFSYSRPYADCKAESIEILSKAGIGVNEKTAREIVDHFGNDIYAYGDIIGFQAKLTEISGIGDKKAKAVTDLVRSEIRTNETFRSLSTAGVPYTAILAYLRAHGERAADELEKDPYGPMKFDADFAACDRAAMAQDMDTWDLRRAKAAIHETVNLMSNRGHTRLPLKNFLRLAAKVSDIHDIPESEIPEKIIEWTLFNSRGLKIYRDGNRSYVSPYRMYHAEESIAENLKKIKASAKSLTDNAAPFIRLAEEMLHTNYTDEQKQAFRILQNGGLIILTGGPGTGKTTTIAGIVEAFRRIKPEGRLLLCAPTGRAAARMSEISGAEAKTIHKAMNLKWYDGLADATPLDYDFIIADEMSMADTELVSIFVEMIKPGTAVILSGDYNQLPSVGPGQVFRDLIESGRFDVCRLTRIIRQGEGSLIKENAFRILEGQKLLTGRGFLVRTAKDDEELLAMLRQYLPMKRLPQILCPVKKTAAGTRVINHIVQESREFSDYGMWLDGICFHTGERVIMNNNNYDAGYMNGDVGVIESIQDGYATISYEAKKLILDVSQMDGMDLAYALTVHKSQGAECDNVLLLLPQDAISMAGRELIYTAITRAKKNVVIIETQGMLEQFLAEGDTIRRQCGLPRRLEKV